MKIIKLVPGSCKECFYAEVKECSLQCKKPHNCKSFCVYRKTCYKEITVTNADVIRQMSNEELAVRLSKIWFKEPKKRWLDWLNSEYKGRKK